METRELFHITTLTKSTFSKDFANLLIQFNSSYIPIEDAGEYIQNSEEIQNSVPSLDDLKLPELKSFAEANGIEIPAGTKKADFLEIIKSHLEEVS